MKEGVDEDQDVLLLHLRWNSTDPGQIPERLPLQLQLSQPIDEGRCATFLAGCTGVYDHRRRG
jgi:hypothetical protein